MADENLRSKHAFGNSENLENAKENGLIDNYDLLMLDGSTDDPKFGWIDKNGNTVLVKNQDVIVIKDKFPEVGKEEVIYIFESKLYFWDGTKYVPAMSDTSSFEEYVETKVEAAVVEANIYTEKKIDEVASAYKIVEF